MNILEDLIAFLSEKAGVDKGCIDRQTLIEEGLGVTGDDAAELIQAFSVRYNVNIDNFVFATYFYEEPSIWMNRSRKIDPLRVGDLARAISMGRLDEEVIKLVDAGE